MMASLSSACPLLLLAVASAQPVYNVGKGSEQSVNNGFGTIFTSLGKLDATRAIQCFANYGADGAGTCNLLDVDGSVQIDFVFNDNETQEIVVVPFTTNVAIVCYSDYLYTKLLMCRSLTINGNAVSVGQPHVINYYAEQVPFVSVARLTDQSGLLCWSYKGYAAAQGGQEGAGVCNKLTLSAGGEITVGVNYEFSESTSTSDISVQAFSEMAAVVCYSGEGTGTCTVLSVGDASTNGTAFNQGSGKVFHDTTEVLFKSIVVVSFSETTGAVCYADGTAENYVACRVLTVNGLSLAVGSEELVNSYPTQWVTTTAISASAALVCYAAMGTATGTDFQGVGTCNVLGLTGDNTTIGAGPATVVNTKATEHMALASLNDDLALLCYSDDGAGKGYCMPLSLATTTTTTTRTTTTSTTTTTTESSSTTKSSTTSPHTTTESSSTTVHSTTESSSTTKSSTTSPHTTTSTETSGTPTTHTTTQGSAEGKDGDSAGSMPSAYLNAGTLMVAAICTATAAVVM